MSQLKHVFQRGKINNLVLPNRIIVAAMTTYSAGAQGHVTKGLVGFYEKFAQGQVGLITVQCTSVSPNTPGARHMLAIYDDRYVNGMRRLTDRIHNSGALVALQLGHLGPGQAETMRRAGWTRSLDIIGPSAVPYDTTLEAPRPMTLEDIDFIRGCFATAAFRAKSAGFDAVEVHACHGRLISMFLSPFYNQRKDIYGGSRTNRARFACEIIQEIKKRVGMNFPLIFKINGSDLAKEGINVKDAMYFAKCFAEAGVDALCISAGGLKGASCIPDSNAKYGCFLPFAKQVKKAVDVPIIAVGKLNLRLGEKALNRGWADFLALARPFLADPMLVLKARKNQWKKINQCTYCNSCLKTLLHNEEPTGRGITCQVNPNIFSSNC
jgi:2,4-dienoyl-CoA reductase-like NADH-dependent reductase (Old Yellow Enzyme family)